LTNQLLGVLLVAALCSSTPVSAQSKVDASPRYREVATVLERMIGTEMRNQALPALSIVLVDGQQVVWAQGFGLADPKQKIAASAETVYRVGSVSKLFTDTALMQLVERGQVDLDAPVSRPADHASRTDVAPLRLAARAADRPLF
jgi:serine beta-lactamase-like protein LACTB